MTDQVVLDASAVLAFVLDEPGADQVEAVLGTASVPATNWAEIVQRLRRIGSDAARAASALKALGVRIEVVGELDAEVAASLYEANPSLSLGDRLCLAVAQRLAQPVYTADRAWAKAQTDAQVVLLR